MIRAAGPTGADDASTMHAPSCRDGREFRRAVGGPPRSIARGSSGRDPCRARSSSYRQAGLTNARMTYQVHIIGGGLAGSEAAWQLAETGLNIRLSEMTGGGDTTPAHDSDRLAEMVCSNSFRSDDATTNAVGLLHQEMRALDSLIMQAADKHRVPAGSALAVDREAFAAEVTRAIEGHPT